MKRRKRVKKPYRDARGRFARPVLVDEPLPVKMTQRVMIGNNAPFVIPRSEPGDERHVPLRSSPPRRGFWGRVADFFMGRP